MILQLNPLVPVVVTSKGNRKGYAFLVTEHGEESFKMWSEVRVQWNWTLGRRPISEPGESTPTRPEQPLECLREAVGYARRQFEFALRECTAEELEGTDRLVTLFRRRIASDQRAIEKLS